MELNNDHSFSRAFGDFCVSHTLQMLSLFHSLRVTLQTSCRASHTHTPPSAMGPYSRFHHFVFITSIQAAQTEMLLSFNITVTAMIYLSDSISPDVWTKANTALCRIYRKPFWCWKQTRNADSVSEAMGFYFHFFLKKTKIYRLIVLWYTGVIVMICTQIQNLFKSVLCGFFQYSSPCNSCFCVYFRGSAHGNQQPQSRLSVPHRRDSGPVHRDRCLRKQPHV